MQSKISCFNRTIYLKNLTRFWPFAVLYTLYLMLVHPLVLHLDLSAARLEAYQGRTPVTVVGEHFMYMTEPISVFLMVIVVAAAVFSYLYQSRSANMTHAFPVTRTELYVTNYLSGLTLMAAPQLLAAFASNLVILGDANSMIWTVWAWFGITLGETIFFYSLACMIVMFTGQLLTAGLFYMICNFLYVMCVALINAVVELFVYGCDGNLIPLGDSPLFPVGYLLSEVRIGPDTAPGTYTVVGISTLLIYMAIGLIFAATGYYIYKKRRLECAGDFLSMGWTKPIVRWGTAMIGGVACAIILVYLFFAGYNSYRQMAAKFVISLAIFGIALFFVAQMFIEKSFRVFRRRLALEAVSCIAVMMIGVALLQFDVFGIESYVPEVSAVEAVSVSGGGEACFVDAPDIEKVEQLHRMIIGRSNEQKNRRSHVDDGEVRYYEFVCINYYLKNDRTVSRTYQVSSSDMDFMKELVGLCVELYSAPEGIKNSYFGGNYEEADWQVSGAMLEYTKGVDSAEGKEYNDYQLYGSKEELQRLYEAVLADMDAGAFAERVDVDEMLMGPQAEAEEVISTDPEVVETQTVETKGLMQTVETQIVETADTVADPDPVVDAQLNLELISDLPVSEVSVYDNWFDNWRSPTIEPNGKGSIMSVWLNLNSRCTNTIQALVDLGEIKGVDDLIIY